MDLGQKASDLIGLATGDKTNSEVRSSKMQGTCERDKTQRSHHKPDDAKDKRDSMSNLSDWHNNI